MTRRHFITCLILPVFLSLSFFIFGQSKFDNARYFDKKDGLSDDHVNDIVQDERGFIWMGTHGGLSRFDGFQFKNYAYDPEVSNSLLYNRIERIVADGNRIWSSTQVGLTALNVVADTFTHYIYTSEGERVETIPSKPLSIAGLYKDQKGEIWCGSRGNGFGRYVPESDDFKFYKYTGQEHLGEISSAESVHLILGIQENMFNDSIIWFGTNLGLLQFNRYTEKVDWFFFPHPDKQEETNQNTFRCLYQHSNGRLYMGNWSKNIYEVDLENKRLKPLPISDDNGQVTGANTILKKNDQEFWISSADGMRVFNVDQQRITFSLKNRIEINKFYGIRFIDDKGRFWLHNYNSAILFDPATQQFITESFAHLNTGFWGLTRSVISQNEGQELVVCSQQSNGIYFFDRETEAWTAARVPSSILEEGRNYLNGRQMIQGPDGGFLINEVSKLVFFNPQTRTFKDFSFQPELEYNRIYEIFWDSKDRLWLGTYQDGLIRWDSKTGAVKKFKLELDHPEQQLYAGVILKIVEDSRQNIWLRRNDGYSVYLTDRDTMLNFLYPINEANTFPGVVDFSEDQMGRMWIASNQTSIGYADLNRPELGILKKFNLKERDHTIDWFTGIETDANGDLWLLSTQNLIKLNAEKLEITHFSFNYGLEDNEFFSFGSLPSGELYFGLRGSIVLVDPKKLEKNTEQPIPYIADIEVLDQPFSGDTTPVMLKSLKLKHNENFFSFDFSAKAFTLPELTQFHFRLKPFNPNWVDAKGRRFANYTNVPPGNYVFQLQAANNEGLSSDYIYELPVFIATPWWQTWWFRTLMLLTITGVIYAFYRYRVFQIRKEERLKADFEKQLSSVEMNALRAQMNPHFLFNCLNSIDSYIIKNETKMASEYLNKFARLVRLILQNSRSNYVNLKDELEALDLYMSMEALRFRHKFEYEISIDKDLEVENIEIPPMLIQPFIENAIWHGLMHIGDQYMGKIDLIIEQENAHLNCIIQDNGIGRAKSAELKRQKGTRGKKSMGMSITKDRMDMIHKMYGAETSVNIIDLMDEHGHAKGTRVELKIPV